MNVLSLCSGIAGIELGVRSVYPTCTIAYVEREAYCVAVLAERMQGGHISDAPIYSSLASFPAARYRGKVDLVAAGFPCQPFSVAGKQQAERDPRHLWPRIAEIIGECEPALVFLENVSIRAFVEPWRDLRRLGFNLSRPFACTAAELGAGHLRRRIFVLAHRNGTRLEGIAGLVNTQALKAATNAVNRPRQQPGRGGGESRQGEAEPQRVAGDTEFIERWKASRGYGPNAENQGWQESVDPHRMPDWWASEPALERMVLRIPNRVDRDRALGNAVVPQQAAFAFASLSQEIGFVI